MRRRDFTRLSVVSLAICLAAGVICAVTWVTANADARLHGVWDLSLGCGAISIVFGGYFIWLLVKQGLETPSTRRLHFRYCQQCGYDLQESPDRCPECGTVPTNAAIASKDRRPSG